MSLIDKYTDEEFIYIVKQSNSLKDLSRNLGYKSYSGDSAQKLKEKISELQITIEHFNKSRKQPIKRTKDNVFCENSTVDQSTLRIWYLKQIWSEIPLALADGMNAKE